MAGRRALEVIAGYDSAHHGRLDPYLRAGLCGSQAPVFRKSGIMTAMRSLTRPAALRPGLQGLGVPRQNRQEVLGGNLEPGVVLQSGLTTNRVDNDGWCVYVCVCVCGCVAESCNDRLTDCMCICVCLCV